MHLWTILNDMVSAVCKILINVIYSTNDMSTLNTAWYYMHSAHIN